jgi:hypothetical protein
VRFELDRVHIDLNRAILAAERLRHRDAGYIGDLIAHVELPQIMQLGLIDPSPFSVIRQTGSDEASNFNTIGGSVPGGRRRSCAMVAK